jgi:hypothetical protein
MASAPDSLLDYTRPFPVLTGSEKREMLVRFLRLCIPTSDACWNWIGAKDPEGYGLLWLERRPFRAHRASLFLLGDGVPDGLVVDHLCRNPACVNPAHLEPVTNAENLRRRTAPVFTSAPRGRRKNYVRPLRSSCKSGHPFDEKNTRITREGTRKCRECDRLRSLKNSATKVAARRRSREAARGRHGEAL